MFTKRIRLVAATATAALVLIAGTAVFASVSFSGQGMVTVDGITVNSGTSSSKAYIKVPISNPAGSYPITIADSLKVTGSTTISGGLLVGTALTVGNNTSASKAYIKAPISNPATGYPITIADSLKVTGNTAMVGGLSVGTKIDTKAVNVSRSASGDAVSLDYGVYVENYLKLDHLSGYNAVPSTSCTVNEWGRVILDPIGTLVDYPNGRLWICSGTGWRALKL
jgi:hypothetical protein